MPPAAPLTGSDLHRIFQELDKNGDGLLSIEELNWLLERIGVFLRLEDLEWSVGKSSLNFQEFLQFWDAISSGGEEAEEQPAAAEESALAEAFKVFDINGDGFISWEELQCVLERLGLWDEENGKDCRSMICFYDTNFDGVLDFQEFKKMMFMCNPTSSNH